MIAKFNIMLHVGLNGWPNMVRGWYEGNTRLVRGDICYIMIKMGKKLSAKNEVVYKKGKKITIFL